MGGAATPGAWPMRAVVTRLILEDISFWALSPDSWCRQTLAWQWSPSLIRFLKRNQNLV
jgi:hypothetical protein